MGSYTFGEAIKALKERKRDMLTDDWDVLEGPLRG